MSAAEPVDRPRTFREVEHKFRVHGLFRIPDLETVHGVAEVRDAGTVELESTYHDTPDLRLAREGITLRRRTGDDQGWHLKLPVDATQPGTRDELHVPLTDEPSPPEALVGLVRVIVRDVPLGQVSTLRTSRSRRLVLGARGAVIAELLDDTVHVIGPDGNVAARFRELELEERAGGKAVARISDALTDAGAVAGEFVAKAVRALGPSASAPPEIPEAPATGPKDPARASITAYLALHARALRAADVEFRRDPDHAVEPVHQLRVAARRLRSGLRTFLPVLERSWAEALRGELAWFAQGLGDLREAEVLLARLDEHVTELPDTLPVDDVRAQLHDALEPSIVRARGAALELLDSPRYLALHDALVAAVANPHVTSAADAPTRDVLPGLVRAVWKRLDHVGSDLRADSTDARWHKARLAAKRTRYAAEAVAPALGEDAQAFAGQIERLTDLLGEHQDAVQAASRVQSLAVAGDTDTETAFALGVLAARERTRAETARQEFAVIWPEVRRPRWRRWLS